MDVKVSDDDNDSEDEDFAPLDHMDVPALPDLDTIHSIHKQRESACLDFEGTDSFTFGRNKHIRKRTRLSTMAGYSINHMTLLKLRLDSSNHMTIQVKADTRAIDAISKIRRRRRIPHNVSCSLWQDDEELADDALLQQVIFVSSGCIQVRFKSNDLDVDFNGHSLQSLQSLGGNALYSVGSLPNTLPHHNCIDAAESGDDDHFRALKGAATTNKVRHKSSGDISVRSTQSLPSSRKHRNNGGRSKHSKASPRRSMLKTQNLTAFHSFSVQHTDDNDEARDQVLQDIEKLLRRQGRQQYSVVKINRFNKHQKRILKLTEYGIENVRPQKSGLLGTKRESVTSFHLWENVSNSYLEDACTIRISFKDYDLGDRKYQTEAAGEINESIQKRLKIIKDQKTSAGRDEISIRFQKKLLLNQIAKTKKFSIGDHVRLTRDRSGHIVFKGAVHFAPSDHEHYGIALDAANGDHDGMVGGHRYFTTAPGHAVLVPKSHIIRKIRVKKARSSPRGKRMATSPQMEITSPFMNGQSFSSQQNRRISRMRLDSGGGGGREDQSTEDVIYKELKDLILANNTIEGRYRVNFTNKFHKYLKEETLLEMVRDFMDAVKVKIGEKHGALYRAQILSSWHYEREQRNGMKIVKSNTMGSMRAMQSADGHALDAIKVGGGSKSHHQMQSIRESVHSEAMGLQLGGDGDDDGKEDGDTVLSLMSEDERTAEMGTLSDVMNRLMESAIEQTILQAKIKEIYGICVEKTQAETQILEIKVGHLANKPQAFFGIKPELESATKWNRAVYELSLLRDCVLPSEKINALINTAHAIYLSNDRESREKAKMREDDQKDGGMESHFITGDDFLPIIIYVVCQGSKDAACVTDADLMFLEGLVDPAQGRGEAGYYLAVFHAALQWIRCFNK